MPNCSKGDVVLIRFSYSKLGEGKIRAAVVVGASPEAPNVMLAPLTGKIAALTGGEFILGNWKEAGLNVESAIKRGIYTVHQSEIVQKVGTLTEADAQTLDSSLRTWLGL